MLACLVWLQVGFLPHFLSVLSEAAGDPTNPLHGKIEFTSLGAAGHSRGAKLAAMHFTGGCRPHRAKSCARHRGWGLLLRGS